MRLYRSRVSPIHPHITHTYIRLTLSRVRSNRTRETPFIPSREIYGDSINRHYLTDLRGNKSRGIQGIHLHIDSVILCSLKAVCRERIGRVRRGYFDLVSSSQLG